MPSKEVWTFRVDMAAPMTLLSLEFLARIATRECHARSILGLTTIVSLMTQQIPPGGTKGTRMPRGRLLRVSTAMMAWIYRRTGGGMGGHTMLLLTTVGAHSGEKRTANIRRFEDGPGRWLVVASAGGQAKHPSWLYNATSHPDQVWAEIDRDKVRVTPQILAGDERAEAWDRIVAEAPQFGTYPDKTDREIPVVRLTRAS